MKAAIVITPKDFRDETVARAMVMFKKWNVEPVVVGFTQKECIGTHGAAYKPDINVAKIKSSEFGVMLLVDGLGVESYKLYDLLPLLEIIKSFSSEGKVVAAVNNSVKIIARANIIAGTKVSIPKDQEIERLVKLYKGIVSDKEMECESNVMSLSDYTKTDEFVGSILDRLGVR